MTIEKEEAYEDADKRDSLSIDSSVWSMTALPCTSLDGLWEQYVTPLLSLRTHFLTKTVGLYLMSRSKKD